MFYRTSVLLYIYAALILIVSLFFILSTQTALADTLPNPLVIRNDATGGGCSLVGVWNAGTKTCTLTQDVNVPIEFESSNLPYTDNDGITLDGDGHSVIGVHTGVGVFIASVLRATIKNLVVDGFSTGVQVGQMYSNTNDVTVQNVTIRNTATALATGPSGRTHISGVTVEHASSTLQAYAGSDLVVERVSATDAGGIRLAGDSVQHIRPTLTDITVSGINVPLDITGTSFAKLRNVHLIGTGSAKNGEGAYFSLSGFRPGDFDHDIDTSNTINGKPIVYWNGKTDTTLTANNAAAVVCAFCRNVTIHSDNLTNTQTGILLYDTQDSTVENITVDDSATGIQLVKSVRNTIRNTTIQNSTYGVSLLPETLLNTYNYYSGEPSTDNVIENNSIANTSYAVYVIHSDNNIIRNNTLSQDIQYLYFAPHMTGASSQNNHIYRNNFIDPPSGQIVVVDVGGNNTYSESSPYGGNYWSTHDQGAEGCNDTDNDRVCDSPYSIPNVAYGGPVITDSHPWTLPIVARCKDGVDNDSDGEADTADSGCHTDFDASNTASYDPLIDNEDFMTSQYYTPLQQVTAQLEYPTSTPQGTAPNLIVLVHGCCNNTGNVQETWESLKDVIEPAIIQNSVAGPWEVLVWDWSSSTPKRGGLYSYADAKTAYINAFEQGNVLGEKIRSQNYKYVHFVGHSAGSNLIDSTVRDIKKAGGSNPPIIHATFLDAFTPNGSDKTYGSALEDSDFAEQYVLEGDLMWTSSTLPHAYNFNVTGISPVNLDLTEAHSWPIEFYRQSSINAGAYGFGLPLSFERSNQEAPSIFYANEKQALLSNRNIKVGDECLLTSATACTTNASPVVEQAISLTRLGTSAIIGGIDGIKKSITGAVDVVVGALPTAITAVLHSGSPVWLEVPLNTTEPYNILKFDYEFLSAAGAEGVMTVFVDDNPVFKIDERITSAGTTTTPDIPIGDLASGQHRVGFRLDPFTDVQSSARVNNIQFGLLTESATTTDTVPPSTPTLLTALPTATSTITLTWATSTDNIGISGYQIFRATSSSAITTLIATTTASTTSYANTGLTASTTYWYQVKAADVAGNVSSSSNKVSTTTLKVITDTTPPTAPNSLTATAASTTIISLTWATSTDTIGVIGYKVERCIGAACTNFIQIATSTLTSYQNTGLAASTTYRFRVRAYDTAGNNSSYSTIVSTTTLPAATAPLTIFSDGFEGSVSWTKVAPVTWYTGNPKVGTHSARLQTKASIEKAKSLAGWKNITISFKMGANSLDTASENVQALYYNGTAWVTLATIANGSANENNQLNPYTFTLPTSMNGKTTFKLKFKINGSATDDYAFIDEVKVMGVK